MRTLLEGALPQTLCPRACEMSPKTAPKPEASPPSLDTMLPVSRSEIDWRRKCIAAFEFQADFPPLFSPMDDLRPQSLVTLGVSTEAAAQGQLVELRPEVARLRAADADLSEQRRVHVTRCAKPECHQQSADTVDRDVMERITMLESHREQKRATIEEEDRRMFEGRAGSKSTVARLRAALSSGGRCQTAARDPALCEAMQARARPKAALRGCRHSARRVVPDAGQAWARPASAGPGSLNGSSEGRLN
ncbi:hypothetical protein [Jannaschia seohaensis]|uniref:Uncharacterized protein n=1 Tax=Jannaschia seohaensis TaxID=475081 RepID=A0A2Y9B6B5_9RHOB|nr:hypothetical protein [Jannaschia seohaensis]PWJ13241.1 hypothetical protein BCF38_1143 [Jannaschia seohaensis]SSA50567.1 hypothetical protein SAMN05421539_1143 [Jannaschia seohaensis]